MKNAIKIYICDDNFEFAVRLEQEIISNFDDKRLLTIIKFKSGKELISQFVKEDADIVFLDIDMPELSGFDAAEKLQEIKQDILIVFVTNYDDLVYKSWRYQPFWFIRKSHLDELNVVLGMFMKRIDFLYDSENLIINFAADNTTIKLNLTKIQYIQSHRHYLIIKGEDGEKKIRGTLSSAEEQLKPFYFIRIQNGIIVNCRYVLKVTSRDVILHNGEKLHISRTKIKYTKEVFQNFSREF